MSSRRRHMSGVFASLVAVLAGLTGCYPASPSPIGQEARRLYDIFFVGGAIVVVLIWVLIGWVIIRYRRRDDRLPRQVRANMPIQVAWVAIPLAVVIGLFTLTWLSMARIDQLPKEPGIHVHVWAFRWQWRFDYPDEGVSIIGTREVAPQLVVPVGVPVQVTLDSTDIAHSFYLPAILYKRDAIPGVTNTFAFTIEEEGTYAAQCAEFCGEFHDAMTFSVRAVQPAAFEQWLAGRPRSSLPPPPVVGPESSP